VIADCILEHLHLLPHQDRNVASKQKNSTTTELSRNRKRVKEKQSSVASYYVMK
jgi:hypothetical protein